MTITINGSGTVTGITAGGLPDAIITQPELATGVAGTGPAFSAYLNTTQTPTSGVWTKILFDAEEFDTNNNFASSRFTPTVAGYYFVQAAMSSLGGTFTACQISIYKNGSANKITTNYATSSSLDDWTSNVSSVIYLNGSTDYLEIYGNSVGATPQFIASNTYTYFSGFLARSA